MTVEEYITELRAAGMTYHHIARAIGAPEATVYNWGNGVTPSSHETSRRLGNLHAHLIAWDVAAARKAAA